MSKTRRHQNKLPTTLHFLVDLELVSKALKMGRDCPRRNGARVTRKYLDLEPLPVISTDRAPTESWLDCPFPVKSQWESGSGSAL